MAMTTLYEAHHFIYIYQCFLKVRGVVGIPFDVQEGGFRIERVRPTGRKAGVKKGDELLAVEGQRFQAKAPLNRRVDYGRPGETLTVLVRRANTVPAERTILITLEATSSTAGDWMVLLVVSVIRPLLCIALGFWGLYVRPAERRAWLLLGVLLSFSQLLSLGLEDQCGSFYDTFCLAFNSLLGQTWTVWLLLFSLHFPKPLPILKRFPAVAYLLIAPIVAYALRVTLISELDLFNSEAAGRAAALLAWPAGLESGLKLTALIIALGCLGAQVFLEPSPDERRRVQTLFTGTSLALLPMIALLLAASALKVSYNAFSAWLVTPSILATCLFPISLTHVVVTPRVLDFRSLTRQILQYSFKLGFVRVARAAVILAALGFLFTKVNCFANNLQIASALALTWAGMLLFEPVRTARLGEWVDRKVFLDANRIEQRLLDFAGTATKFAGVDSLLDGLLSDLEQAFRPSTALALLPAGDAFRIAAVRNASPAIEMDDTLESGSGVVQRLEQTGEAILLYFDVPDRWMHSLPQTEFAKLRGFGAQLWLPVFSDNMLYAAIGLGPKPDDVPYSNSDLRVLRSMASSIGLVIERMTLQEKISLESAARERLIVEKKSAEVASAAKSSFLAGMSHELRTPLSAIIGYSDLLVDQATDDNSLELLSDLKKIQSAGRHLLEIINSILDISKIEAGKMDIYLESFSVAAVIEDIVAIIDPLVQKNRNRLTIDVDPNIGSIHSDRTKIRQTLFNLLSNACKFTQQGQISISTNQYTEEQTGAKWVSFRVSDTGMGMKPEQMEQVFKPFSQADASISGRYGGTGLGLTLSRQFVGMLGGTLTVTSEYMQGTAFTVRVPDQAITKREPTETRRSSGGAPRILLIDDDPAVHDLVRRSLVKRGYQVISSLTGAEGLKIAKEARPDAILLDVLMDGMDGFQVLTELRSDASLSKTPVIMMTIVEDKQAGLSLGATEYLIKPVGRGQLNEVLGRYCPPVSQQSLPGMALVVDDEPGQREIVSRMLRAHGWDVREAGNGRDALERLSEGLPRVVFLDLMMPVMDGFAFLDEFRQRPDCATIPVMVLTSKIVTQQERQKLSGIVSEVLQKRAQPNDELLSNVMRQLSMRLGDHESDG